LPHFDIGGTGDARVHLTDAAFENTAESADVLHAAAQNI
jgi:hypothetical protein